MALSVKRVGWIIALVATALAGLVVLQVSLLNYAMTLKEQAFRRNIMAAMGQISHAVSTGEALMFVQTTPSAGRLTIETHIGGPDGDGFQRISRGVAIACADSEVLAPLRTEGGRIHYVVDQPQHVRLRAVNPPSGRDTVYVDTFLQAGEYQVSMDRENLAGSGYYWEFRTDSVNCFLQMSGEGGVSSIASFDSPGAGKLRTVTAILQDLVDAEFDPIEERLDSINIDSVIATTLDENGIDLAYAYGVMTEPDDSLRLVVPAVYESEVLESDLRVRLFPQDIFAPPSYLSLYFPDRRAYLWKEMGPLLLATVVLMGIITACFAYAIRTILRQRRYSASMTDFINNMTHEFKTPISTVALATEATRRPDVIEQKDQVRHYSDMIASENQRMRSQTEKILQIAALEENDFELSLSDVDVHDIIQTAVDTLSLRVQSRGGSITCHLEAARSKLAADRVHLSSIIHNLLDNADKYSDDAPEITVRTFDSDRGLGIRIEDRGIGLKPEDRKRDFEKYFRVPTGNRHDVKGFGLGLSYVKMMVEAHGGTVELFSKFGEGTQVEMILPVNRRGTEE